MDIMTLKVDIDGHEDVQVLSGPLAHASTRCECCDERGRVFALVVVSGPAGNGLSICVECARKALAEDVTHFEIRYSR